MLTHPDTLSITNLKGRSVMSKNNSSIPEVKIQHRKIHRSEVWKAIKGIPGYEVSNHGRLRSYWKRNSLGIGKGSKMTLEPIPQSYKKLSVGSSGYEQAVLYINNQYKNVRVHLLVLEAFIGSRPKGMDGCHNDGDKHNNHVSNLRWDTRRNNLADAKKHGTAPIGERHGGAKLSSEQVIEIRNTPALNYREIADKYNVSYWTIKNIINFKSWTHI